MNTQLIIFAAFVLVILLAFLLLIIYQNKKLNVLIRQQESQQPWQVISQWLQEMRSSLERHTQMIQEQLFATNKDIGQRLDNTAHLMRLLNQDLGEIHEIGQQMRDFQHLLRSPKLRGNIGEQILKDLLHQVLPQSQFKLQHRFQNGQSVDAIIKTVNGLIPIDAKFPMENFIKYMSALHTEQEKQFKRDFIRDVKRHIDNISQNYIVPHEGTLDFAVMYVPSEAIFHEIIKHDPLNRYAQEKNVLLVSPNSFYYFLRIILMASEGQRIEEASKRILQLLNGLRQDAQTISGDLRILTTHINNAKNATERLNVDFQAMVGKMEQAKLLGK